jgi:3-phenylpropionate/trans-cinnamate dioxygenase ferredoxin reductase component
MSQPPFVIIGAGLAGAKAAEALRALGHESAIVLIGDESDRPYERPPLSKDYLQGKSEREKVFVHPQGWYRENEVELHLGGQVTAIDKAQNIVALADGSNLEYAKLLIATGSRPRTLDVPGGDCPGLLYLRRLDDSDRIRSTLATADKLVIVGAGWIGLEVAAAARAASVEVTIVEAAELPLLRVLGSDVAQSFAELHVAHGVDLRLGTTLAEITTEGGDRPSGVRLADGSAISANAVLIAVGAAPNTELAEYAGLAVDNGVTVDDGLRTSDPDIFAAGDVASALHPLLGKHIRVEHWANALNQPEVAAASMLGRPASYERLPYFYTDQYDLGMEYLGYTEPGDYDAVTIRGDLAAREYIAFWTRQNRVLAAMNVNTWDVGDDLKAIIGSGAEIPADRLADQSVPLVDLV